MNVEKKKSRVAIAVLTAFVMACATLVASGSDAFAKSYPFRFAVKSNQKNVKEKRGRDRGNVPTVNRWGVLLLKSGEGKGSWTDFWLTGADGEQVSKYMRVRCGGGWYKQDAYENSRSRTVFLFAEDNKDKPSGYSVKGRWKPQER